MSPEEKEYYLKVFEDILDGLERCYKPETVEKVMRDQGMGGIMQLRTLLFAYCHKEEWMQGVSDQTLENIELN